MGEAVASFRPIVAKTLLSPFGHGWLARMDQLRRIQVCTRTGARRSSYPLPVMCMGRSILLRHVGMGDASTRSDRLAVADTPTSRRWRRRDRTTRPVPRWQRRCMVVGLVLARERQKMSKSVEPPEQEEPNDEPEHETDQGRAAIGLSPIG